MRAVYVTYDGLFDPLGATQALPYVEGLADHGVTFTIISFEKAERDTPGARAALESRLHPRGIRWIPLRYHPRPRLPATLWDCLKGARALRREARDGVDVVHCRGDVAMAMARWARLPGRVRLLYDVRGLFADERVEVGSWSRDSLLDRSVRAVERANLAAAHGLVTVTRPALDVLLLRGSPLPPHAVIPPSVDVDRFTPRSTGEEPTYGFAYVGSFGTWYMGAEMAQFLEEAAGLLDGRALVLTPDVEPARRAGITEALADVRSVAPADVPAWLRRARATFFFIHPTPGKLGSFPTKFAESLACGLPVLANRGIGDLDEVLERERVGVQLDTFTPEAFRTAARQLVELLREPEVTARCRALAESRYSVRAAVAIYGELYRALVAGPASPSPP